MTRRMASLLVMFGASLLPLALSAAGSSERNEPATHRISGRLNALARSSDSGLVLYSRLGGRAAVPLPMVIAERSALAQREPASGNTTASVGDGETEPAASTLPVRYDLRTNYPNPFNPTTTIEFDLPEMQSVELSVFDTRGRHVATLVRGTLPAGRHAAVWEAAQAPTGVYYYRLRAGDFVRAHRMVLIK